MASGITTYLGTKIIDHFLRNATETPVATVYLGLYTATPSNSGGGTEVSGSGYARQALGLDAASAGLSANTSNEVFGPAGADWGTVTHVGIFDASTSGNLLWWGALTASRSVPNGATFTIVAGDLDLDLDNSS